jgi:iron complex outermembrane recepter protein
MIRRSQPNRRGARLRPTMVSFAGALSAACSMSAFADAARDVSDNSDDLGEVVVTSTRQAEPLSRVPISVEVFTEKQMDEQGVKQFADIARLTPGLTINNGGGGGGANNISIRGVSSSAGASTTGIYIDDVPIQVRQVGYAAGTLFPEVFDLERVEVLRGPQGTLFGAGSEGGTVRFIQTAPSLDTYSGYSRAEGAGTQDAAGSYEAGSAFGGPILRDVLGFRVSAFFRHDGGYIDRVPETFTLNNRSGAGFGDASTAMRTGSGQDNANSQNTIALRAALKAQLADNLSITPSFYLQHQTQNDIDNTFNLSGSDPSAGVFTNPLWTVGAPTPGGLTALTLPQGQTGYSRLAIGSIVLQWDMSFASLYSTTAYLDQQKTRYTDQTTYYAVTAIDSQVQPYPNPGQKAQNLYADTQKVFSEEIRLQSNNKDSPLNWVAGGFYSHANQFSHQYTEDNIWGNSNYFYGGYVGPGTSPFGPGYTAYQNFFGTPLLNGSGTYFADARTIEEQEAGFGQLDWKIFNIVTLTGGVRVSRDKLEYTLTSAGAENNLNAPYGEPCPAGGYCTYDSGILAPSFPSGNIHNAETAVTPKAGVSVQITANNFVYASATKGYRPGGAQAQLPSGCNQDLVNYGYVDASGKPSSPLTYKSDTVWSYEVGTKNKALDGKLTVSASGYIIKWKDIQQSLNLPMCGYALTDNLGSATIKGFDLILGAIPLEGLSLNASVGFTHTALDNGLYQPGGVVVYSKGSAILDAGPPWTEIVSAEYAAPAMAGAGGYIRADYSHTSKYAATGRTDPTAFNFDPLLPTNTQTTLVNGRLGVRHGPLDVSLFCNNLFNSHPLMDLAHGGGGNPGYLWTADTLRPRTVGVTAAYRY